MRTNARSTFSQDKHGSAAIEFALTGLATLFLILETMQTGFFFVCSVYLEHATDQAARAIQTGIVAQQSMTADQFRLNVLCTALPVGMPCSRVIINVRTVTAGINPQGYYAFVKNDQSDVITPAMDNLKTSFCPGNASKNVYLQAFYAMPVISPFWTRFASTSVNGENVHYVAQSAVFKNEPFGPSAANEC